MPKIAPELSPARIRDLASIPGLHAVGGVAGLLLQVSLNTTSRQLRRSWILRVVVGIKRRDIGLGSYPTVTLAMARERARKVRDQIADGIDPVEERRKRRAALIAQQAAAITFGECAKRYISAHEAGWRSAKHAQQWRNSIENYAFPVIGALPIAALETAHVMQVVQPIWLTKTTTASRVRNRIEIVWDWAKAHGFIGNGTENPARWRGHLEKLLPARSKVAPVEHHPALPYADMPGFMVELRQRSGTAARCLEFTILTWLREGEASGARWDEIDQKARQWLVPGSRMKGGKDHVVPLSDAALAVLETMPRVGDYVFPGPRSGRPLSDDAMDKLLRRMGYAGTATAHGFRSTAKDWASETTAHADIVSEMALAHVVPDQVQAAYRRGDLLTKRRKLMADWGRYCGDK
jgi:integrase